MSVFDEVVALLDELSWDEQLALIGILSERVQQVRPGSTDTPDAAVEEQPEEDAEGRRWLPRLKQMIDWDVIKPMEATVYVLGEPDKSALLLDAYTVAYQGQRMPINEWARNIKGWKSINIYPYLVVQGDGRTLDEIRRAYMDSHGME